MPTNLTELAWMIAKRDNISFNEAYAAVDECQDMINDAMVYGTLDEIEDILRTELGIEPDYFDLFL